MTERQPDAREHELVERDHLLALHADVGIALGTLNTGDALTAVANAVVRRLDAAFARIWTLSDDGTALELRASAGLYTHLDGAHGRVPVGQLEIGLIAAERLPHVTNNVVGDPRVRDQEWARSNGMVSFAGYPMVLQGRLVGVIAAFARHPLSEAAFSALQSIAWSVALGIERAQAMEDVRASERSLSSTAAALVEQAVVSCPADDAKADREGSPPAVRAADPPPGEPLTEARLRTLLDARAEGAPPLVLQEVSLPGANLRHLDMRGVDFSRSDLSGAHFGRADLRGAVFESVNLQGSDLANANLQKANFCEANLEETLLEDCDLTDVKLRYANARRASFENALLTGADLHGADLRNADLAGANLRGANLQEANLEDADLSRADLFGAILTKANLQRARLGGADLTRASVREASFRESVLTDARLDGLDLTSCDLTNAHLGHARFDKTVLRQAQIGDALGEELAGAYEEAKFGYLALERNFLELGELDASRWAYLKRRRMQKLGARAAGRAARARGDVRKASHYYASYVGDQLVEWLCDYGESVLRVFGALLVVYLFFTLLYGITGAVVRVEGTPPVSVTTRQPMDLLVFSLLALTTSGSPSVGLQARDQYVYILSGIQALVGISITGLLGFVIGNRIRR